MKVSFNARNLFATAEYIFHANPAVAGWEHGKSIKALYDHIYEFGMQFARSNGRALEFGHGDDFSEMVGTGGWYVSYSHDNGTIHMTFLVDPSVGGDYEPNDEASMELEL